MKKGQDIIKRSRKDIYCDRDHSISKYKTADTDDRQPYRSDLISFDHLYQSDDPRDTACGRYHKCRDRSKKE